MTIRSLQIGNVWFEERQGGLDRVYHELFRHLPNAGVQFRGLVIGSKPVSRQYENDVEIFASPKEQLPRRLLSVRASVRRIIESRSIDLIVSHFALYGFAALSEIRRLPLVVHFQGPWAAEAQFEGSSWLKSRVQAAIEKSVYRRASRLIVLSHAFARELISRYGIPEAAIRVVPAGVDTTRFDCELTRRQARERLNWPDDRFIVVAVRRLVRRMGLEDLVDAIKLLARKTPGILLYIAGTGLLSQELEAQISSLGLEDHVRLLGRVDEASLPLVYRAADLSVVPTLALEGFGMIALESLASGTPAMVTPVGGLPEVVAELSRSLIFDSVGANAIARGIEEVLRGERRLPSESECRVYTEKHFTWPVVAEAVRRVYLEALA